MFGAPQSIAIGITLFTLFTLITFEITRFPDYLAISPDENTTTLYYFTNTSALVKSTRQLNHYTCHRRRPPPVRRQSPTTITRGCYATSDHCLWPLSTIHKPNYNNRIYIQHRPIATYVADIQAGRQRNNSGLQLNHLFNNEAPPLPHDHKV